MLKIDNDKVIFDIDRCQQCGVCEAMCPKDAISLRLRTDGTHDVVVDHEKCVLCGRCVRGCPSNVVNNYSGYFDAFPDKEYFLGYNTDEKIRRESSSGGVCKTLIIEALKNRAVDGVYTLERTERYPYARGRFYTADDLPGFATMPNSVYHSVPACAEARSIKNCRRIMIVGTACQLRALTPVASGRCEELIKVCIFCKQQKTLDSTRFLAKVMGTEIGSDLKFSATYRGDGWPGIVKVNDRELKYGRAAQVPFGRRLFTVPGCDICGDSFGTLAGADITLMDPWNIRRDNALGDTLTIAHTPPGQGDSFSHRSPASRQNRLQRRAGCSLDRRCEIQADRRAIFQGAGLQRAGSRGRPCGEKAAQDVARDSGHVAENAHAFLPCAMQDSRSEEQGIEKNQ